MTGIVQIAQNIYVPTDILDIPHNLQQPIQFAMSSLSLATASY